MTWKTHFKYMEKKNILFIDTPWKAQVLERKLTKASVKAQIDFASFKRNFNLPLKILVVRRSRNFI